ncbi:Speckle-type POZ protein [Araneus ventricosus]|uniref:Speckle-type POZ protein n=1 Tax=Araneus ventricosus TaxID=182803 RepID=A0A4Y2ME36_ARAVE|nr:Speckle-type POZ protein [Araneus ventricosus]
MAAKARNDFQRKAHFTFIWTIENGTSILASEYVESPSFIAQTIEKTKWKLMMHNLFNESLLCIFIHREDDVPGNIEIEFELSVQSADGTPIAMKTCKRQFAGSDNCSLPLELENYDVFFQRTEFLSNDSFIICCQMWKTGIEVSEVDTCFARTRLGVDRRSCIWAIRHFSTLVLGEKIIHFVNPTLKRSPQLILSFSLSERNGKTYVNIQIDQDSATRFRRILCKLCLLDNVGRVVHSEESLQYIYEHLYDVYTFEEFIEKDKLVNGESSVLENDVLYLRCEFLIGADPIWSRIEHYSLKDLKTNTTDMLEMDQIKPVEASITCCPFKKIVEDLYEDESSNDVILRAGAKSFPAHKKVLINRSPKFKTMFDQDTEEKTGNIVDIPDFNAETLGRLLFYIYKDTVQELQCESAMDLFRAANIYELPELQKKCSFVLKSKLSVTNVCSILSLAGMHDHSEDLKKAAEDFIFYHANEVLNSDEWKRLEKEHFFLTLDVSSLINMYDFEYDSP